MHLACPRRLVACMHEGVGHILGCVDTHRAAATVLWGRGEQMAKMIKGLESEDGVTNQRQGGKGKEL